MQVTINQWTSNPSLHTSPQSFPVCFPIPLSMPRNSHFLVGLPTHQLAHFFPNNPSSDHHNHDPCHHCISPPVSPSLSIVVHTLSPIPAPHCDSHLLTTNLHPSFLSLESRLHPRSIVNFGSCHDSSVCGSRVLTRCGGPITHGLQPPPQAPYLGNGQAAHPEPPHTSTQPSHRTAHCACGTSSGTTTASRPTT